MTNRKAEPPAPEIGAKYRMPDGSTVEVASTARDHTGLRVNEVQVWSAPPPPARPIEPAPAPAED
jgi:hypothetical protein